MMGLDAAFLGVALLLGGTAEPPSVTADEFQGWFEAASRGDLRIPGPVARRAKHFRYVFVGGFRMGRTPGYFTQNAEELRALGVPRRAIHFLYPDSYKTVEENRQTVRDEILRIAGDRPERLVIIAHSRGACDALTFALHEPEFVRDRVEALFLIQGPFGGTGLADYVLGEGEAMDERMSAGHRFLAQKIGAFVRYLFNHGKHGGLTGLTREASRAYWSLALEAHDDAIPIVGPKVFYVEANVHPSRLGLFMRAMASYLGAYYGPNDGVVAVEDQTIPGLGTSLGVVEAGHADLTRRFPSAHAGRRSRRALIRSIVMAVGRSDSPSSAPQ
jgi:pimeloyl-ACP methyl ester carboxylesterase